MEWIYGISGTVILGWAGWVSLEIVKNHDVKAQLNRIEEKLDNFIERFL